jgi:hypothetical protein
MRVLYVKEAGNIQCVPRFTSSTLETIREANQACQVGEKDIVDAHLTAKPKVRLATGRV